MWIKYSNYVIAASKLQEVMCKQLSTLESIPVSKLYNRRADQM